MEVCRLKVLGSSSEGNCYILDSNNKKLIIELGVSWVEILKGLNYKIEDVAGLYCQPLLATSDHANKDSIRKAIKYGIPVFSCEEVAHENKGVTIAKKGRKTSIGGFKIQPIPLQHLVRMFRLCYRNS